MLTVSPTRHSWETYRAATMLDTAGRAPRANASAPAAKIDPRVIHHMSGSGWVDDRGQPIGVMLESKPRRGPHCRSAEETGDDEAADDQRDRGDDVGEVGGETAEQFGQDRQTEDLHRGDREQHHHDPEQRARDQAWSDRRRATGVQCAGHRIAAAELAKGPFGSGAGDERADLGDHPADEKHEGRASDSRKLIDDDGPRGLHGARPVVREHVVLPWFEAILPYERSRTVRVRPR